jgi:ankyrin repeat protein
MKRIEKLQKAIKTENIRMVKKLLKPAFFGLIEAIDVNKYFNGLLGSYTPILYAVEHGKYSIVEQLILCGANVNHTDNMGNTSLILAAKYGYIDIVQLLLVNGIDVNATNHYNETALTVSSKRNYDIRDCINNEKIVSLLIAKGADVNAKNKDGITPLLLAINDGNKRIAEMLIKAGADTKQTDKEGISLLQVAILSAYKEGVYFDIVKMLVKNGVNIKTPFKNGNTPIKQALIWGRNVVADWLMANGAIISQDEKEHIEMDRKREVDKIQLGYFCKTCGCYKCEQEVVEDSFEQDEWVTIDYFCCMSCGNRITDENGNWVITKVRN